MGEVEGNAIIPPQEIKDEWAQLLANNYAQMSVTERHDFASEIKNNKFQQVLWPLLPKKMKAQQRQQWAEDLKALPAEMQSDQARTQPTATSYSAPSRGLPAEQQELLNKIYELQF